MDLGSVVGRCVSEVEIHSARAAQSTMTVTGAVLHRRALTRQLNSTQ